MRAHTHLLSTVFFSRSQRVRREVYGMLRRVPCMWMTQHSLMKCVCVCVRLCAWYRCAPSPTTTNTSTHQTGLHPCVMEPGSSAPLGTGELSDVSSSTPASRHEYLWGYISKPKATNYSIAPTQQARFLHSHLPSPTWKSFLPHRLGIRKRPPPAYYQYLWTSQQTKGTIYYNSVQTIMQLQSYGSLCLHLASTIWKSLSLPF